MESNACGIPLRTPNTWVNMPETFENEMGCSTEEYPNPPDRLRCLRHEISVERVVLSQDTAIAIAQADYPVFSGIL